VAGNASVLETAWTAVAVAGTGVAVAFLVVIWLSYRAVMSWIRQGLAVAWGPRHLFVVSFLVGIGLLLLVWLGFDALGANAMLNPPPLDPERQAASDRGGWILVGLEAVLFCFQIVLLWAWVAIGRTTLHSGAAPRSFLDLLRGVIDDGREVGHAVANDLQRPVAVLEEIAEDASLPEEARTAATLALDDLGRVMARVHAFHQSVKRLEPRL
jgi:hypothetical protein